MGDGATPVIARETSRRISLVREVILGSAVYGRRDDSLARRGCMEFRLALAGEIGPQALAAAVARGNYHGETADVQIMEMTGAFAGFHIPGVRIRSVSDRSFRVEHCLRN